MLLWNKWYVVLDSREVRRGRITRARRLGMDLIFWRDEAGAVHALDARCPHRGADLGLGEVVDGCVKCPYHGFEFDGEGGTKLIPAMGRSAKIPASYRARSFKVREFMNFIFLWHGDAPEGEIRWFNDIDESFTFSTIKAEWSVDYTRAMENQLDVFHLPFVHRNTIGRGGRTVVNGPVVELNGDVMDVWTCNEEDRGQRPRGPGEVRREERRGHLQLIFPNYWQNIINDDFRVVAAFAPVSEEETVIYVRLYQRFLKLPMVSTAFNYLVNQFNKYVLNQDRRVVESQRPKQSDLYSKEYLVRADLPILMLRKYLREHAGPHLVQRFGRAGEPTT